MPFQLFYERTFILLMLLNAPFSRRKAVSHHRWILKRNHRRMILNQPMMNSWIARAISWYSVNRIAGMRYPSHSDSTGEWRKSHCMRCRCIHKLAYSLISLNLYLFNIIVYILSTVLSTATKKSLGSLPWISLGGSLPSIFFRSLHTSGKDYNAEKHTPGLSLLPLIYP